MDLGRFLAQPRGDRDGLNRDADILGLPQDRRPPVAFEVMHGNWPAYRLFCRLDTQWRYVQGIASGGATGLDYTAVESVMNMRNIRPSRRPRLLDDLQLIEKGFLKGIRGRKR